MALALIIGFTMVVVVVAVKWIVEGVIDVREKAWENRTRLEHQVCPHGPEYTCRFCRGAV